MLLMTTALPQRCQRKYVFGAVSDASSRLVSDRFGRKVLYDDGAGCAPRPHLHEVLEELLVRSSVRTLSCALPMPPRPRFSSSHPATTWNRPHHDDRARQELAAQTALAGKLEY